MANFKGPMYNYEVAPTTVVAADLNVDMGGLFFGTPIATAGRRICDTLDLIPGQCFVRASVAEVLQVSTVTFTAANSTVYTLNISQYNPLTNQTMRFIFTHTSLASGSTATTIADAFRTQINADGRIKILASGTTTLVLTAEAGYATFLNKNAEPSTTVIGATTAGVVALGTTAALAQKGIVVGAGLSFTQVHLEYNANGIPMNTLQANQPYAYDIFIDQASGAYAAVLAKFQYTLLARLTSVGGAANPEWLAVV